MTIDGKLQVPPPRLRVEFPTDERVDVWTVTRPRTKFWPARKGLLVSRAARAHSHVWYAWTIVPGESGPLPDAPKTLPDGSIINRPGYRCDSREEAIGRAVILAKRYWKRRDSIEVSRGQSPRVCP